MKLICREKEINLYECKSFFDRFRGFMLCRNIDRALLFNNCNSIHTFFMYKNIDVIMCDKNNKVLYYYPNFKKNKVILPKKNVCNTYETPALFFDIHIEDYLEVIE